MTISWNDTFVETLRQQIPSLPPADQLTPDTKLYDLGLDSLRSVQLLIALEDNFDITIPDEMLTAEAFQTPSTIWTIVQTVDAEQHAGSRETS